MFLVGMIVEVSSFPVEARNNRKVSRRKQGNRDVILHAYLLLLDKLKIAKRERTARRLEQTRTIPTGLWNTEH